MMKPKSNVTRRAFSCRGYSTHFGLKKCRYHFCIGNVIQSARKYQCRYTNRRDFASMTNNVIITVNVIIAISFFDYISCDVLIKRNRTYYVPLKSNKLSCVKVCRRVNKPPCILSNSRKFG